MPLKLRLAVRDWDYLTPLALGDVRSPKVDLVVDRVGTLVPHLGRDPDHDAAEMSFSRYAQLRADADDSVVVFAYQAGKAANADFYLTVSC